MQQQNKPLEKTPAQIRADAAIAALCAKSKTRAAAPKVRLRYATVAADGTITGFYSDHIHKTIPPGAVLVTDEQHKQFFEAQNANPPKIHKLIDGVLV